MYSKKIATLGSGSFGSVFKARKSHQTYALKVIDLQRLMSNNVVIPIEYIEREIAILKKLSHPNIVGLTEFIQDGDQYILAMEFCGGPTLDHYVLKRKLTEENVRGLFVQLAAGLKYMWTKNIIHRDLKPQNILFTSDQADAQLKIIDFGFSQIRNPTNLMTSVVGTPIYMAPEILQNRPYTGKSDLWSVGCILFEILVGRAPFAHATSHHDLALMHQNWTEPKLPETVRVSPSCLDLLTRLMKSDPVLRMDWNEFFTHPFITSPESFAESLISVHIAPTCRYVTLNTRELDYACKVSVMKAHLLAHDSEDAEKYYGVAALLQTKDGQVIELLDDEPVSRYKEQLLGSPTLYLVLPLDNNKQTIEDTAFEVLDCVLTKDTYNISQIEQSSQMTSSQIEKDNVEMANLHADFMQLADQMREIVRGSREMYETCRVFLECRENQLAALSVSMKILTRHRNELCELSESFKKSYKEPMERAIVALPALVEQHIYELRRTPADAGIPSLQGKTMLDCLGEAEIRHTLKMCIEIVTAAGHIVDSCDTALEGGFVSTKAFESIKHVLEGLKYTWTLMSENLGVVENLQDKVESWVVKVDEHLCGANSWLGFSFEDPIREGLEGSREHVSTALEAAKEVRRLAQVISANKEMWDVLVGEFSTVAGARAQVFGAFSSLHICGEQSYIPQQRIIDTLQNLPEVGRKYSEQAVQIVQTKQGYEKKATTEVRAADEAVQKLRVGLLDSIKSFRTKFDKQPLAKGFVNAVDTLTPPAVRVSMNAPEVAAQVHTALVNANTQNAQLRDELTQRHSELASLKEHARQLSSQLGQARHKEWENAETIRLLQEQLRWMQMKR